MKNEWIAYRKFASRLAETSSRRTWETWFSNVLENFWRPLVDTLNGNSDPQICRMIDQNGEIYWYVYDPGSGVDFYFETENDVRIWIEHRYYTPAVKS